MYVVRLHSFLKASYSLILVRIGIFESTGSLKLEVKYRNGLSPDKPHRGRNAQILGSSCSPYA